MIGSAAIQKRRQRAHQILITQSGGAPEQRLCYVGRLGFGPFNPQQKWQYQADDPLVLRIKAALHVRLAGAAVS